MSDVMSLIRDKRKKIAESSGRKERPLKPALGKNRYRILRSWKGEGELFFHEFGQHWIKKMVDGKEKVIAVFVCDAVTHDKRCEVCEALTNAKLSAMDDEMVELLKNAESNETFLFNAINHQGDDKTTPIVLQMTKTTADQFFSIFEEYGEEMLDPEKGTDIVIERTGAGFDTRYKVLAAAKSKPIDKSALDKLVDLDEYVADSDDNRRKALTAVGVVSGTAPMLSAPSAGAAAALEGPKEASTDIEVDDDDMATVSPDAAADADVDDAVEAGPPAAKDGTTETAADDAEFNSEVSDADLDKMLADL